jgi:hypothetical protein
MVEGSPRLRAPRAPTHADEGVLKWTSVIALEGHRLIPPKKLEMELSFYDVGGYPVVYCDGGRYLYEFGGLPLAYLEGDSVYAFGGQHLGWWDRGWVRDHHGALVFFTDAATGAGPPLPARQRQPAKGFKNTPPTPAFKHVKPVRVADSPEWSLRSGMLFFQLR